MLLVFEQRKKLFYELEKARDSKVLLYYTGNNSIRYDSLDLFKDHLTKIGVTKRITLILDTDGGNIETAVAIAELIHKFADDFETIIPFKAHSAGTLLSLACNTIIATRQATFTQFDPSISNEKLLGPGISVAAEDINHFTKVLKESFNINSEESLLRSSEILLEQIPPTILGYVDRVQDAVEKMARKLLRYHMNDEATIQRIISSLCKGEFTHQYRFFSDDLRKLGLNVIEPDGNEITIIDNLFHNLINEKQYNSNSILIESLNGGTNKIIIN